MNTQQMNLFKGGKNNIVSAFLVVIFFILVMGGIYYYSSNSGKPAEKTKEDVVLTLEPSATTVKVNDTFTVNVMIDTKTETVSATELHLNYGVATLEGISIAKGSFLPAELVKGSIGIGQASITLICDPANPRKGAGTLATLTFKAISAGSAQIQFDGATQVAAINEASNAVGEMIPATVVVQP